MANQEHAGEVVLIRHAQSQWNRENRFSGWADPPLTEEGIAEARKAGKKLYAAGYRFDYAYSSRLQRSMHTLEILLAELGQRGLTTEQEWRLNAQHCGALQGLNKEALLRHVGPEQFYRLRRGYLDLPPPLALTDAQHPVKDPRYADIPRELLPSQENLDQTRRRVTAFWNQAITPRLEQGQRILISAHGSSLRALIMALAKLRVAEVETFEFPTAAPIVYRFDRNGMPLDWHYLADANPCIDCAA